MAMMAWLRQAPLSPAARNMLAVIERLKALRDLGVDRALRSRVTDAAFEQMAAEGSRMTVQHLGDLATERRQAMLTATVIRMEAELTDAVLSMFDKLMDSLGRKAERRTAEKTLRSVRDAQTQLATLAAACRAVIVAKASGADPFATIDNEVGWKQFERCVGEAEVLAKPETTDPRTEMLNRYATVRAFGPA